MRKARETLGLLKIFVKITLLCLAQIKNLWYDVFVDYYINSERGFSIW